MSAALEKLVFYFGPVGTASIVVWMAAAALSLLYILGLRRTKLCWTALVAAVVGLGLAWVNSANISEIEIDRSAELEAGRQRAARMEEQEDEAAAAAEDADNADGSEEPEAEEAVEVDDEEVTENVSENVAEEVSEEEAEEEAVPEYRKGGVVQRTGGMKDEDLVPPVETVETAKAPTSDARILKDHEFAEADRLDNVNLFCARWTLYLALLLAAVDYLRRLNRTFDSLLPLPLGGRLVDSMFAKRHAEVSQGDAARWQRFLEQTVRKGETFIYFCGKDPWPEDHLRRLPSWIPIPWRLAKLSGPAESDLDAPLSNEFVFESSWFNRYCFVLTGDGSQAARRLDALADFLEIRHETRASARHTVNVLWDHETPIPPDVLDRLLPLCGETNFRLILATSSPASKELLALFEGAPA